MAERFNADEIRKQLEAEREELLQRIEEEIAKPNDGIRDWVFTYPGLT